MGCSLWRCATTKRRFTLRLLGLLVVHTMPEFSESQLYTASMRCFFQGNEYVLADAAYPAKSYILPALKKPHLQPYQPLDQQFNLLHSHVRVKIEHCFGMLKGKFQSLRELRSTGVKNNACIMYLSAASSYTIFCWTTSKPIGRKKSGTSFERIMVPVLLLL